MCVCLLVQFVIMAVMLDLPFSHLNDEEFNLVLYEFANGSVSFDEDRLSSLVFNPLLFDYNNNLTMWADLDTIRKHPLAVIILRNNHSTICWLPRYLKYITTFQFSI